VACCGWDVIMGGGLPLALLKIVNLMKIDCRFRGLCPDADFSREMSETHQIMIKLSRTHLEGIAAFIIHLCEASGQHHDPTALLREKAHCISENVTFLSVFCFTSFSFFRPQT
jgi:hypothetical protein